MPNPAAPASTTRSPAAPSAFAAVASDIMGVSGRAMLEALIAGERDTQLLAGRAKRRLRNKIPELTEALTGRFRDHHAFLARLYLDQYDQLTSAIDRLTARIEEAMAPFSPSPRPARHHPRDQPGGRRGDHRGDRRRHEQVHLRQTSRLLGLAAFGVVRTNNTYLQARCKRLTARRGPLRALVAVE
ncbi:hypothetical protein [Streptomyces canus]|nr:hypothetical protein [Streptomyces canus]KUN02242.1 hypothetical protein AQI96_39850 [Streptomyces canus]